MCLKNLKRDFTAIQEGKERKSLGAEQYRPYKWHLFFLQWGIRENGHQFVPTFLQSSERKWWPDLEMGDNAVKKKKAALFFPIACEALDLQDKAAFLV